MLSSGNNSSRGSNILPSDMPPLPLCLPLEPITLGNQKYTRSGEVRRLLSVPLGNISEDHSFGVAHSKPSPPVATEELKHFKDSVQDASRKARDRAKMLRGSIFKLDKYREALSSKKRQRSDLSSSERSGGANLAKMGNQIPRNPHDVMTRRFEDRAKSVGLNKRVRTSVSDVQVESRSVATSKQQMVSERDGEMLQVGSGGSVRIEGKIRRLPAGGEGWDKKIKKKRSVGAVVNRVVTGEQDIKRAMHPKLSADSKLRSCDTGFRSKSSPGVGGANKFEGAFELANSNVCTVLRNEPESVPLPRDRTTLLEQRVVAKGNNKRNIREDNSLSGPNTMIKGKVSRAPRTGSIMALDSSPNVQSSGSLQGWEQPTSVNKVSVLGVANSQKGPMSTGSSSHPIAQWVGQRPHNNSRTRRANLVSPVSNHVEAHISSQGFATSDFSARTSSVGVNGSLLASSVHNNTPKFKRELESIPSPVGLSESEESGAGENGLKQKGPDCVKVALSAAHKFGTSVFPTRKNKIPTNEIGDGMRRQGRSGRGSSLTRLGIPPTREKLENPPTTKPLQGMRPGSDKNRGKSGRPPSKKLKDRKGLTRVGPMLTSGSSDFTGESDDDHEELYAAACSAHNASDLACSGPFWKKMEYIFASVSLEDTSYLKQQLSLAEELDESLSRMFGVEYNFLGVVHKEIPGSSGERHGSHSNLESAKTDALSGRFDSGRLEKAGPLYQRVLSALIEEDEIEEFYHHGEGKNMPLQYVSDDSHCGSCNQIEIEPKDRDRMESEADSNSDYPSQKNGLLDRFSCDKSAVSKSCRNPCTSNSVHSNEQWQGDYDFSNSDVGLVNEMCQNDLGQVHPRELNVPRFSSSDCQYQLMCVDDKLLLELQSIGLYPESLPDLADGEEVINQDFMELKEGLYQQIGRKKKNLGKIDKAIQYGRDVERRNMEEVAMNQLIEMAYRKQMACRGSNASKSAVRKVSKQVAFAFVKRTLARCRKFEDTGISCFSEPALWDVIFSAPPCNNDAKSVDCVGSGTASNTYNEAYNHQEEARGSGAVCSTFKRYDSHSENLDRGSSDALPAILQSSEQAPFPHEPVSNKGKKREVLIDDVVGSASSRVTSALDGPVRGGVKGKRSERDRDQNRDQLRSHSISGAGRSPLDSSRNERKTKAKKTKQKNNHLSTSGNELDDRFREAAPPTCPSVHGSSRVVTNGSNKVGREVGSLNPRNSSKESEEPIDFALNELDSIELGVSNDLGGHQDLSTLLNFDEDGLQDHDSIGLEIPMDDLSDLNMLI